ncbi:MAG TPA: flagellar biosynthetic protein FliQ [Desulfotomaculum sp.]|nr:flagellar biosynthetic protein FliQ [Desulfotomaculum sp.]
MTEAFVLEVARHAVWMILLISLPILGTGLIVGLAISILQAATQIQEQTLTFVPKLIVTFLVMVLLLPWIMHIMGNYTVELYSKWPGLMR